MDKLFTADGKLDFSSLPDRLKVGKELTIKTILGNMIRSELINPGFQESRPFKLGKLANTLSKLELVSPGSEREQADIILSTDMSLGKYFFQQVSDGRYIMKKIVTTL